MRWLLKALSLSSRCSQLKNRIEFTNTEKIEDSELKELILIGENEKLEMKSTLRYDLRQNIVNKNLEYVIAKTVSAFLNSEGGILIIGVDDNGNALGLEKDIETFSKKDVDGFELHLRNIIKKHLGSNFEKHLKITFPIIDEKTICKVKILKSGKPVFANFEGKDSFYVRNGNSSIPKNREEQSEYEKLHWK
jgi:predicted HTH transcriptional regulator